MMCTHTFVMQDEIIVKVPRLYIRLIGTGARSLFAPVFELLSVLGFVSTTSSVDGRGDGTTAAVDDDDGV